MCSRTFSASHLCTSSSFSSSSSCTTWRDRATAARSSRYFRAISRQLTRLQDHTWAPRSSLDTTFPWEAIVRGIHSGGRHSCDFCGPGAYSWVACARSVSRETGPTWLLGISSCFRQHSRHGKALLVRREHHRLRNTRTAESRHICSRTF